MWYSNHALIGSSLLFSIYIWLYVSLLSLWFKLTFQSFDVKRTWWRLSHLKYYNIIHTAFSWFGKLGWISCQFLKIVLFITPSVYSNVCLFVQHIFYNSLWCLVMTIPVPGVCSKGMDITLSLFISYLPSADL